MLVGRDAKTDVVEHGDLRARGIREGNVLEFKTALRLGKPKSGTARTVNQRLAVNILTQLLERGDGCDEEVEEGRDLTKEQGRCSR